MITTKCKVCEKEIKVKRDRVGSTSSGCDGFTELNSDEGVAFRCKNVVWFCNECWEEILCHGPINKQ